MSLVSTLIRSPSTLLYFLKCSPLDGVRGSPTLPLSHGLPQLHESDDARRDRQPERDHTVREHSREHDRVVDPEDRECADHARVDGAHPSCRRRNQVRGHAEEETLHEDGERDVPPKASKLAHRTPMFAAQKPTAPPTASRPRCG